MFYVSAGKILTGNLFDAVSMHVKQHAAIDDATAELKQAVEGEGSNVGLAPPLPAVLHVLLKLQPPTPGKDRQYLSNFLK